MIFKTLDWGMSLESISGRDINGDGEPDLVFVGYSGGAHCCWTYWIVSLGGRPGLIKKTAGGAPSKAHLINPHPTSFEPRIQL